MESIVDFLIPLSILYLFSIPVYYLIHSLLKKWITNKILRILVLWLLTIVSTPVFFISCIVLFFMVINYYPKHAFTANRWAKEKDTRYEIEDDLIDSKLLIGKSKAEVIQLLELEGNEIKSDSWRYFTGKKPGLNFRSSVLKVDYKAGKVKKADRVVFAD